MRDILSKLMAGSAIAGAALLVAACQPAADTTENNMVAPADDTTWNDMDNMGLENETWDANMGTPVENALDHLDNAQEELENAQ